MVVSSKDYRYHVLQPESEPDAVAINGVARRRPRGPQARRLALCLALAFVTLVFTLFVSTWGEIPRIPFLQSSCHNRPVGYQCKPDIAHSWGQYSPYHSIPSELPSDIPKGCEVTFAQVLSRHGSRDPTLNSGLFMLSLINKLHREVHEFKGPYAFLEHYNYTFGTDQLTAFGQGELVRSGAAFYKRYRNLAGANAPFVRASGQQRVIESAVNFTSGMQAAAQADHAPALGSYPPPLVIIPEGSAINNTLDNDLCTAAKKLPYSSIGKNAKQQWALIFATPIAARLNADLPGASLTTDDAIQLMHFCPFSVVASPTGAWSPFCNLFTDKEWRDYDYYQTLDKYYGYGPGNPFGATQGIGFVNELIARLTGKPVSDHTSVNQTLDRDDAFFPVGPGHNFFADFSHDNNMVGIYAAMGLYNGTSQLDRSHLTPPRAADGFSAAWVAPFAARMYVEKMRCRGGTPGHSSPSSDQELVRVLINDRVIPLSHCDADKMGRCQVDKFVESLKFARSGGNWEQCFMEPNGADWA